MKQKKVSLMYCVYCGRKLTLWNTHVDHIVPKVRGGYDSWDNKLPICKKCNLHKNSKPPIQFLRELLKANDAVFQWNQELSELPHQNSEIPSTQLHIIKGEKSGDEWYFYKMRRFWYMKLSIRRKDGIDALIDVNLQFLSIMLGWGKKVFLELVQWLEKESEKGLENS